MFTTEQLSLIKNESSYVNSDGTNKDDPRTGEPYKHTAFMSIAGQRWNDLDEKKRETYEKMAAADKLRYENEMKEWTENDEEFYTKPNGTKSNAGLKEKVMESPKFADEEKEPVRKIESAVRKSRLSK